ncbi:MAG: glycosyltransferase family 1 protein [bacterium]
MKIGIDARSLIRKERAGLEQYLANLISHLEKIDNENQYFLFFNFIRPQYQRFLPQFTSNNFHNVVCPIPSKIMTRLFKASLPIESCLGKLDVFHAPRHLLLPSIWAKTVLTIHDLMFIDHPEFLKLEWVKSLEKEVHKGIKRANLIISVSLFTKNRILENWKKMSAEKIKVIYSGVNECFYPIEDKVIIDKIKHKYGIKNRYILFVGNVEPKKNLIRLFEAFSQVKNSIDGYNLVIAGGGWAFDKLFQKVKESNLQKDVIFTGYISDEDLPALYSGAEIFVFPSLYEGFGLPVIEAMACGTPVITSNSASLPELARDAGILIDPFKVEDIAGAMYQLLTDTNLKMKLKEKGLQRAKLFSWEKTASETLAVYKELA